MKSDITPRNGSHDADERRARKRVRALKDFYSHLATYLVVNAFLVAINLTTTPDPFWAIWPIAGWGIGIVSHAISVFGLFGLGTRDWEERKVRELMQQQNHLTADHVRDLLRQELPAQPIDGERLIRRLEHLETIVTSRDWDMLEDREPNDRTLGDDAQASVDPATDAERIARRVR